MRFKLVRIFACAMLLWQTPLAGAADTPEVGGIALERLQRLDALLEREIAAGRVSGMVVAVARHGEVIQRNYGYMDLESREPMRADALFRLYSMTKPIASVALLTLYEQGLFQLTDPLDKYIPQFAELKVYAGKDASGRPILEAPKRKPTIQDAFRHTLGLSGGLGNTDVDALYREVGLGMFELDSLRQEMDRLATVPLRYSPGDQWVYGLGHDVQAYLVEHFSGMPYADYVRKAILEPLGMRHTVFGVPPAMKRDFATVYNRDAAGKLVAGHRRPLRAVHRSRLRHAEPVGFGARLSAFRAHAAERRRARWRAHPRPQNGGADGAEPPAAEHSVDRRQRSGRDGLRARRVGDDRHGGARPAGIGAARSAGAARRRPRSA